MNTIVFDTHNCVRYNRLGGEVIAMATITVRVTEDEKEFLDRMAKFENKSLSDLLKSNTMRMLEDKYDASIAEKAYKEYLENKQAKSLKELSHEYGVDK